MISFSENMRIIMRVFYTLHTRTGLMRVCVCAYGANRLYSIRHNHSHNSIVKLL